MNWQDDYRAKLTNPADALEEIRFGPTEMDPRRRPYSGFGGQADFMRGAARSQGGKPVIAIADPRFRDELWAYAERAHYVEPRPALV